MDYTRILFFTVLTMSFVDITPGFSQAQSGKEALVIPKAWDDAAMATLEVPLAEATASPIFPPAEYYYRIPVLPIYKSQRRRTAGGTLPFAARTMRITASATS